MSPPPQLRQQTFNCSSLLIYRPRKDERLSWHSWLTYSRWLTHISGHPSATSWVQDSESTSAKEQCSTAGPRNQRINQASTYLWTRLTTWYGILRSSFSSFVCITNTRPHIITTTMHEMMSWVTRSRGHIKTCSTTYDTTKHSWDYIKTVQRRFVTCLACYYNDVDTRNICHCFLSITSRMK